MSTPEHFLQDAVREKAERDLAALDTRRTAVDAIAHATVEVGALAGLLAQATPAIASTAADAAAITRLKKLRRALDEARVHADDLALALDVEVQRTALADARRAIHAALRAAGIEPASVDRSLAVVPGAVVPGAVAPGAVAPGAVAPGVVAPGVVAPGVVAPGVVAPGVDGLGAEALEPVAGVVAVGTVASAA